MEVPRPGCGSPSPRLSAEWRCSCSGGFARDSGDTRPVTERLVLIDSNSLIYRAFFAVPPLTTTKGELANATFGFASILRKALEQTTPQHIAAEFDLPQPTFRHEREATYKATRRPMPDELRPQLERCKQLLEKFGIPMYSLPGYEADDVIGALARQAEAKGLETIIVSGDLDPLQLVSPLIKLMTTRQGFQNTVIYDEELIRQRYGLRPDDQNIAAPLPARPQTAARGGQMQLGLETPPAITSPAETTLVADVDVDDVVARIRASGAVAVHADIDASGGHPTLVGLGLAAGERVWYLPTPEDVPPAIAEVLRDDQVRKTAHDAKTARRALP